MMGRVTVVVGSGRLLGLLFRVVSSYHPVGFNELSQLA